jgi:serine/threonine protein kinase
MSVCPSVTVCQAEFYLVTVCWAEFYPVATLPLNYSDDDQLSAHNIFHIIHITTSYPNGKYKNIWSKQRFLQKSLLEQSEMIVDLAKAVRYLHSWRILHRDLKPGNIGFDHAGVLKVFLGSSPNFTMPMPSSN